MEVALKSVFVFGFRMIEQFSIHFLPSLVHRTSDPPWSSSSLYTSEHWPPCPFGHFESFFLAKVPQGYCVQILHLTLEFLSYDPNFTDNMEEDTDDEIQEDL
nr:cullin-associated NEDD8-dissociated protein 1 [Ipomoea batatas]